ncbi:alanine--tRNA ligase [Patescibacteria group bacterium]|nr:alanine--tRNA ligase [Patescibacteria group bacterium]
MQAAKVIEKYISFFKNQGHLQIPNSPLVPENDPTTLFTSSGMQPLIQYLLGEIHPQGKRLVNIQNCFRAQDIEEVGDNRHTTFFRMLGNWSLGDYFKKEQLPWLFAFLTNDLNIDSKNLCVTVFEGYKDISKDEEVVRIWQEIFRNAGIDPKDRIFTYGVTKNWWSRSGVPDNMPPGEPGGPDSEVFYDYGEKLKIHEKSEYKKDTCHVNCNCGRYLEIGNSVFMQYLKKPDGNFKKLTQRNVDFGGGLERLVAVTEGKQDVFTTSLFSPIIKTIEKLTKNDYAGHTSPMRIVTDHLVSAVFISSANITPSNKEQGYILRRLIRRAYDNFYQIGGKDINPVIEAIVGQYKDTDSVLVDKFESIKLIILEEIQRYADVLEKARQFIEKKYKSPLPPLLKGEREILGAPKAGDSIGDELMGTREISVDDAFFLYSSHGLSPTQIKSLGFVFDNRIFAKKMKEHQALSRKGAGQKFTGGLSDHRERTIMGHTATHLLHQALREVLGSEIHQTGSNITTERLRFDFNYELKLTDEQIKKVEEIVNNKIKSNLPVHFDLLPLEEAKKTGAIGLFDDKYPGRVKVYFIGEYSKELCGGPHVDFTRALKSFKIIKQENIGNKQRRIYAVVG